MRIFPVFFARVSPASQSANPACIKNTKIAAIRTQITSVAEYIISPFYFPGTKKVHPGNYIHSSDAPRCTGRYFYDKRKSASEINPKRLCFYA